MICHPALQGFRWQRDMSFLPTVDLSIGDLRMPFNEEVKYCILGISATLFLIALSILVWQLYRYRSYAPRKPRKLTKTNLSYQLAFGQTI